MDKERYFVLTDAASADNLNGFLERLENDRIEYETDYEETRNGNVLVVVSFED